MSTNIVSVDNKGKVIVWKFKNENLCIQTKFFTQHKIISSCLSNCGKILYAATSAGFVDVYIVDNGQYLKTLQIDKKKILSIMVTKNNKKIVVSYFDGSINIYDIENNTCIFKNKSDNVVTSMTISNTLDCLIFSRKYENKIFIINLIDGTQRKILGGHDGETTFLLLSKNEKILYSADSCGKVIIWNLENYDIFSGFLNKNKIISMILGKYEKYLYLLDYLGNINKWSLFADLKIGEFKTKYCTSLLSTNDILIYNSYNKICINKSDSIENIKEIICHNGIIINLFTF